MNLVPFQFVGWLLVLAAFFLGTFALVYGMRPVLSAGAAISLLAAAVFLNARSDQLTRHSPVTIVEGTVSDFGLVHNRGGDPFETIQLRQDDGQLTPVFDTRGLGLVNRQPPVQKSDRMRASFYSWTYSGHEREPFAMLILSGKRRGWWYRDSPPTWTLTYVTAFVSLAFFSLSLYRTYRRRAAKS